MILLWNLTVILNCRLRWEKLIFRQLQYHDFLQNLIKGSTYSKRRTHELVWYGLWHMACIRLMALNQGFEGGRRTSSSTLHSWTQTWTFKVLPSCFLFFCLIFNSITVYLQLSSTPRNKSIKTLSLSLSSQCLVYILIPTSIHLFDGLSTDSATNHPPSVCLFYAESCPQPWDWMCQTCMSNCQTSLQCVYLNLLKHIMNVNIYTYAIYKYTYVLLMYTLDSYIIVYL